MFEIKLDFWTLYQRIFYIEDPSLAFLGMTEGPFAFMSRERQSIVLKHYLKGEIKLPSKESMLGSYN